MTCTLEELRNNLSGPSAEYRRKQLHPVPDAPVVVRETFILERVKGKAVLDIGASGKMHEAIVKAAKRCYGIDRPPPGWSDVAGLHRCGDEFGINLDDYHAELPQLPDVELVVCGEVLEHLANPGFFLERLRRGYNGVPVIISVPNAFNDICPESLKAGIENVNDDHVAWYSFTTLKTLLRRYGYEIREWCWYKGRQRFAEGLIAVTG